jgi:hypothetical protein
MPPYCRQNSIACAGSGQVVVLIEGEPPVLAFSRARLARHMLFAIDSELVNKDLDKPV